MAQPAHQYSSPLTDSIRTRRLAGSRFRAARVTALCRRGLSVPWVGGRQSGSAGAPSATSLQQRGPPAGRSPGEILRNRPAGLVRTRGPETARLPPPPPHPARTQGPRQGERETASGGTGAPGIRRSRRACAASTPATPATVHPRRLLLSASGLRLLLRGGVGAAPPPQGTWGSMGASSSSSEASRRASIDPRGPEGEGGRQGGDRVDGGGFYSCRWAGGGPR